MQLLSTLRRIRACEGEVAAQQVLEAYVAQELATDRARVDAASRLGAFLRRTNSIEPQETGWQIDCLVIGAPNSETLDDVLRA